jgi:hypothetical protein
MNSYATCINGGYACGSYHRHFFCAVCFYIFQKSSLARTRFTRKKQVPVRLINKRNSLFKNGICRVNQHTANKGNALVAGKEFFGDRQWECYNASLPRFTFSFILRQIRL